MCKIISKLINNQSVLEDSITEFLPPIIIIFIIIVLKQIGGAPEDLCSSGRL